MQLVLLHGRHDPNAEMMERGFDGPALEGVSYVHYTYATGTIGFEDKASYDLAKQLTGWPDFDRLVLEI